MTTRIDSVLFFQLCAKDRLRGCKLGARNIKQELADGVYEVVEHDGTLSYAFVSHDKQLCYLELLWMDEREYELHLYDEAQLAALDRIMDFEPDELDY